VRFQISAIILASVLLSHMIGLLLYAVERGGALRMAEAMGRAEQSAGISRVVQDLPADARDDLVRILDSQALRVWVSDAPAVAVPEPARAERDVAFYLRARVPDAAEDDVRVRFIGGEGHGLFFGGAGLDVVPPALDPAGRAASAASAPAGAPSLAISIRHDGDEWINFLALLGAQRPPLPILMLAGLVSAASGIALAAFWLARRVTAPLTRLSEAAESLGRNLVSSPLPVSGPREVAVAAAAFNTMQQRLVRLVHGRMALLAAISHDLRTPLTQIRLRLEMTPASPERERNLRALDDVDAIIGTSLAYARASHEAEERSRIDLGALVGSVCDDLADGGAAIECDCPAGLVVSCKRLAIKRAVTNLVENALKYGREARVGTRSAKEGLVVSVEDRGPGIPPSQIEAVFEPFHRGGASGSADGRGVGLGLSIAQAIAEDHGGEVRLSNRKEGGLRAELVLPR
jgi:signal transduction histidine kinase